MTGRNAWTRARTGCGVMNQWDVNEMDRTFSGGFDWAWLGFMSDV